MNNAGYIDFTKKLKLLIGKSPQLITTTLSNIFTMRLVGTKTHGDLAEIAITEFINQYVSDFKAIHVGKSKAKKSEEDLEVTDETSGGTFTISLKAYGLGAIQLSTDRESEMITALEKFEKDITDEKIIIEITTSLFSRFSSNVNVLALIYDESKLEREKILRFKAVVFDYEEARKNVTIIKYITEGKGRIHPVYRFFDSNSIPICEVRYGKKTANGLQRGFWSNTNQAAKYFDDLTDWLETPPNNSLVDMLSHALLANLSAHEKVLIELQRDIEEQRKTSNL